MLRASLKGLLSRKLRLSLSVLAIVLGVAFMSGALVLTDSLSSRYEKLFATVNQNVAVQVALTAEGEDADPLPVLTQQQLDQLGAVDGVSAVSGDVSASGVVPFKLADGKPLPPSGTPQLGVGVTGAQDPLRLLEVAEGRWPAAATEVSLTRFTADQTGAKVGDKIKVWLPLAQEAREFDVVGIAAFSGGRASLAGETMVAFAQEEAQRLFYGDTGRFSGALLGADPGVTQDGLRDRVAAVVPPSYQAKTGEQANADEAGDVQAGLSQLTMVFGPFAAVALLVGAFLIFNTFNIVVAQRARELALFRALGARRRQIVGAVVVEAVLVGLVGSTLGLIGGILLGFGGSAALGSLGGAQLPGSVQIGVTPIVLAYVVGVLVTVIAALVPAIRASKVPPVAAMRDVDRPDKPLRRLAIVGAVFAVPGLLLVLVSLGGGGNLPGMMGGALLVFVGALLLAPLLTRPLAGLIGKAVAWRTSGRLGVRNVQRSPRRSAVTAAALMIGVTLVSAASVVGQSFTASIDRTVDGTVGAQVVIQTDLTGVPGDTGFPEESVQQVQQIPGVDQALPLWVSRQTAAVGATPPFGGTFATDDLASVRDMFAMEAASGSLDALNPGQFATDENTASAQGWKVGDTVAIKSDKGGEQPYQLVGTYRATPIWTDTMIVPKAAVANFPGPLVYQGYVSLDDGADTAAVVAQVQQIMNDFPMVTVGDQSKLVADLSGLVDVVLAVIYLLLGLTILIALLGITNTLLLSISERTRELGLLRAVGLDQRGVRRMVGAESVVLAIFGCVVGIVLGIGLGMAVSGALIGRDFLSTIAIPWGSLVLFIVLAGIAGVLAALLPARRAARLDVLRAIAYE